MINPLAPLWSIYLNPIESNISSMINLFQCIKMNIDRLRKTGDAAGHKTVPCGAGNAHFCCPTGAGPKDITARIKSSIIPWVTAPTRPS